jgi:hypothetical protein
LRKNGGNIEFSGMEGVNGLPGRQILSGDCGRFKRHVKSIDNALQRVKRKLEKYLDDRSEI